MKLLIKSKFFSTCLGTVAIFLGIGFILPISNFSVYITSYIHLKHKYVTMHYGFFINLIYSFSNAISHTLGGYLENLIGFYKTIIVGFIITFIVNFGFIFQQDIWLCYCLTFVLGFGTGISTSLLTKNITLYLPDKKGIISGIFGFGVMIIAAIFSLSGEKLINFEGKTLEEEEIFYPERIAKNTYLYFLIGEFLIPIGLIFGLLLTYEYKPEEINNETLRDGENQINLEEKEKETDTKEEKKGETKEENEEEKQLKMKISKQKIKQVIKTIRYWRITFISFFLNISTSYMVTTGRTFGALIGINGTALQFSGIIQTIFVIIIGPILGILVDKKGPLLILRITTIVSIFPSIFLGFFMKYTIIFITCFVIYILILIGLLVGFIPFIMDIFGIQESVILGGIINGFSKISEIISTVCAFGFSIKCGEDKECLKSRYQIMYFISAICCGISCLLLFFEKSDKFNYDLVTDEKALLDQNKQSENLVVNPDEEE